MSTNIKPMTTGKEGLAVSQAYGQRATIGLMFTYLFVTIGTLGIHVEQPLTYVLQSLIVLAVVFPVASALGILARRLHNRVYGNPWYLCKQESKLETHGSKGDALWPPVCSSSSASRRRHSSGSQRR